MLDPYANTALDGSSTPPAAADSDGFWTSLTNSLLNGGARYFEGRLTANTKISITNSIAATIGSVVKFVAIVFGIAVVVAALFKSKS